MKKVVSREVDPGHRDSRRLEIRKILTRRGGRMSTDDVNNLLAVEGASWVNQRTTRRDLDDLMKVGYIVRHAGETGDNHRSWYWSIRRQSLDVAFTPEESLTVAAALQHAEQFGFWLCTDEIGILRDHLTGALHRHSVGRLTVEDRVFTGSRFNILKPGRYKPEHLTAIQTAMIEDYSLQIRYRPRQADNIECSYTLCPLAFAYQDCDVYLVAFVSKEKWHGKEPDPDKPRGKYSSGGPGTVCVLMLNRMVSVTQAREFVPEPEGFDLRSPSIQKELGMMHDDKKIDLELALSEDMLDMFSENEIGSDQRLERSPEGWKFICKTMDTEGLRSFLLGYAKSVQVVAPLYLREHICAQLEAAVTRYRR